MEESPKISNCMVPSPKTRKMLDPQVFIFQIDSQPQNLPNLRADNTFGMLELVAIRKSHWKFVISTLFVT